MIKQLVLAAALAAAGVAHAQPAASAPKAAPASAAKKELVAKVIQLQQPGIEAMARSMAEQPALQTMQMAGIALQRLPADKRETVAREIEAEVRKYAEETVPLVRERALRLAPSALGPILEERFTEDELRQIVATLESPVNRKFQSMAGDMQRALGEKVLAESRAVVEPKVQAMQQAVARRLGIAPAGGASAPPPASRTPAPAGRAASAARP